MKKIFVALALVIAFSGSASSAPSGKQVCYQYHGGPFLVFEDLESKDRVAVGYSGNGVDPYAYENLNVTSRTNLGCDVCFELASQYINAEGKKVDVKILTEESNGGSAFIAEVHTKIAGSKSWKLWHSNLRCIDWSK